MTVQIIITADTALDATHDIETLAKGLSSALDATHDIETLAKALSSAPRSGSGIWDRNNAAPATCSAPPLPVTPPPLPPLPSAATAAAAGVPSPLDIPPELVRDENNRTPVMAATAAATSSAAVTRVSATNIVSSGVGQELDARGYVWDARIHSKAKTKKKDGNWKVTRGTDAALVAAVEAELAAAAVVTPPTAPASAAAVTPPMAPASAAAVTPAPAAPASAAAVTPAPAAPAPVPAPTASASELYPKVATKMSNAIISELITPARCTELLRDQGVEAIPELVDNVGGLTALDIALDGELA